MADHALLSASGSHRWLNCTPSALLEQQFENKSNSAAEEGTAAHNLCEHKLKKALKRRSKRPTSKYDSDEMDEYTNGYVDFVVENLELLKQQCKDPLVLIEQRLDFSNYVPEGFGTGDCVIVADKQLHIIDFKYGQGVVVDAVDNSQMKLYALGALETYDALYDIEEVSMTIYQPRRANISTWTISALELKEWADTELINKALLASQGEGEFCSGTWCQFCRAATICRKRAQDNLELAQFELKMPPLLTDDEVNTILVQLTDLVKWAGDVSQYAANKAIHHGKQWEGFKVVEGRSNRVYVDEQEAIRLAKEHGYLDIYKRSVISLTEMEKLMGKKEFQEILGHLIVKPQGKLTFVPSSDKRKEVITKIEFNEIGE